MGGVDRLVPAQQLLMVQEKEGLGAVAGFRHAIKLVTGFVGEQYIAAFIIGSVGEWADQLFHLSNCQGNLLTFLCGCGGRGLEQPGDLLPLRRRKLKTAALQATDCLTVVELAGMLVFFELVTLEPDGGGDLRDGFEAAGEQAAGQHQA